MRRRWIVPRSVLFWLLLFSALGAYQLGAPSVWFDEGWSAAAAAAPTLKAALTLDDTNPPLYYGLLHLYARGVGTSEFALRSFSLLCGLLALALTVRLAGMLGKDRGSAAWLGAVNLPLIWAAHEMRMYTLLALLVAVLLVAYSRLQSGGGWRAWVLLIGAELALLYSHNTAPVIVLGINAVWLLGVLWWYVGAQRAAPLRILRPALFWLGAQAAVALLWWPYFNARFLNLTTDNSALIRRTPLGFDLWAGLWVQNDALPEAGWMLGGIGLALFVIGNRLPLSPTLSPTGEREPSPSPFRGRDLGRGISLFLLITLGGLWAALAILGNELHGRYQVLLVPALMAACVPFTRTRPVGAQYIAPLQIFTLLMVIYTVSGQFVWFTRTDEHDDARTLVQHYADTLTAADSVLAWSYADRYELAYYWQRFNVQAQRITLPEGADLDVILPLLPTSGIVEQNVWYGQRADYRGMLSCLLLHGITDKPSNTTVDGMVSLRYAAINRQLPALTPLDATFSVARVDFVGQVPRSFTANQWLCLPIQITLTAPTAGELKAALIVQSATGEEIARADAVFATPNGRTSLDGTLNETLTAYPHIALPMGTLPERDYRLMLRLYDDAMLSGYDWLVGGSPAGKQIEIGGWRPVVGAQWLQSPYQQLELLNADIANIARLRNGDALPVTLRWGIPPQGATLPALQLTADDGAWQVSVPTDITVTDDLATEQRVIRVPLDARDGQATLTIAEERRPLATFEIAEIPYVTALPPDGFIPLTADAFPTIGKIEAYQRGEQEIVLAWRVAEGATITQDYTVFVQALDAEGRLIAQSDSAPAGGTRPTSGWRGGEVVLDAHTLSAPFPTDSRLIAGLYNRDGVRVRLPSGADYVVLSVGAG